VKPDVQTFEVDGSTVALTKVPVRRYDWDHRGKFEPGHPEWGHPREKSLYEIAIDGKKVGWAFRPHGWGRSPWGIDALWGPGYDYDFGEGTRWNPGHHRDGACFELSEVARRAVALRAEQWRPLMTEEEMAAERVKIAERKARDKVEEEARREQWAREREERERAEREQRDELTAGLESINERFNGQLSNLEANAVRFALERLASGRWK
jgi:hypothetical protein